MRLYRFAQRTITALRFTRLLPAAVLCAYSLVADAQQFPAHPITLIVPFASGPTDAQYRKLAGIAAKHLGQPVIVLNKPGAGGTTGPALMAKNDNPDGYTISAFFINSLRMPFMQKVDWDPLKDFTYIMGLGGYTFVFSVLADSQFKTMNEVIEYAKRNPGKLSVGTPGAGTSIHLLLEALGAETGAQFIHVGFKGGGETTTNLLGGHVMATNDVIGSVFGQAQAGKVRILMTFDEQRSAWLGDVPTAKELGYHLVYNSPYGLVGPRGMPPGVVNTLYEAFRKAANDPDYLKFLDTVKQVPWLRSPKEYEDWARAAVPVERAFVERAGLLAK